MPTHAPADCPARTIPNRIGDIATWSVGPQDRPLNLLGADRDLDVKVARRAPLSDVVSKHSVADGLTVVIREVLQNDRMAPHAHAGVPNAAPIGAALAT